MGKSKELTDYIWRKKAKRTEEEAVRRRRRERQMEREVHTRNEVDLGN